MHATTRRRNLVTKAAIPSNKALLALAGDLLALAWPESPGFDLA